jgi:conserved oligomeric Golgi complex subunit 6
MTDANSSLQQQSHSVLTDKVARALQVRTDTPAMKAALEALSHLHPSDTSATSTSLSSAKHEPNAFGMSIDSRSVRVAIEQDALQQALRLQEELRSLVKTVQHLREGVSQVEEIAQRVREATVMQVITTETANPMIPGARAHVPTSSDDPLSPGQTLMNKTGAGSLEAEQKLASVLADSFLRRNICRKRLEAVHAFLERFDLSQEDSRLLDHYAFEDVPNARNANEGFTTEGSTAVNGFAFLNALERVRKIRLALTDTFGSSDDITFLEHNDQDIERRGLGAPSALRMMDSLAQKQERAYERLYHWLQHYLQLLSSGGAVTNNRLNDSDGLDEALQQQFVKRSLYTLRHVPAFYAHTLELIASNRRAEETRRFLLALTSGYAGFPPIEMKAHDPVVCKFVAYFCFLMTEICLLYVVDECFCV